MKKLSKNDILAYALKDENQINFIFLKFLFKKYFL